MAFCAREGVLRRCVVDQSKKTLSNLLSLREQSRNKVFDERCLVRWGIGRKNSIPSIMNLSQSEVSVAERGRAQSIKDIALVDSEKAILRLKVENMVI